MINLDLSNPKCQNPECKSGKRAMIKVGDKFVCGECAVQFEKNKNKIILDIMNAQFKEGVN